MSRLLYALSLGLVGAALICVALLLALPGIGAERAWRRLEPLLPMETPKRLDGGNLPVAAGDPLFRVVLCRFDLRNGPLRVSAMGRAAFWSAAVFRPDGRVAASVNSGLTGSEAPDLLIVAQDGVGDANASAESAFPLVADVGEALLALRVAVPDESWESLADALLKSVSCRTERRER